MDPFYGWSSTASRVDPIRGAVYFLPLSSQIFLVKLCQYYQTSLSCHYYFQGASVGVFYKVGISLLLGHGFILGTIGVWYR